MKPVKWWPGRTLGTNRKSKCTQCDGNGWLLPSCATLLASSKFYRSLNSSHTGCYPHSCSWDWLNPAPFNVAMCVKPKILSQLPLAVLGNSSSTHTFSVLSQDDRWTLMSLDFLILMGEIMLPISSRKSKVLSGRLWMAEAIIVRS